MGNINLRESVAAGKFYPARARELNSQIASFLDPRAEKRDVLACIMPHAGYIYSGPVAGAVVSRINVPPRIVLLGPNHTGQGTPFSLMSSGKWKTPLGEVALDRELGKEILSGSEYLLEDSLAHLNEHSLEVELPFFQYFRKDLSIVPVCVASADLKALRSVGLAIAAAVDKLELNGSVLIAASSDMSHYLPQKDARRRDKLAIEAVLRLDEEELLAKVVEFDISMCGFAPVIAMLYCAKALGAVNAELVKYQTSGDITGDHSSVVGYAGMIIN